MANLIAAMYLSFIDLCLAHMGYDNSIDVSGQTLCSSDAHTISLAPSPEMSNDLEAGQTRDVQDATSALNSILGENDPAVQMIDNGRDSHNQSGKTQLACSLARMVLLQPDGLSSQTKEQLKKVLPQSINIDCAQRGSFRLH